MRAEEFTINETNFLSRALGVKDVVATVFSNNDTVVDIHIEFRGQHTVWEQIQSKAMFSYSEDICGPIMGFGFNNQKEYIFTIGLSSDQVTILSILTESTTAVLETLLKAEHNPAFAELESYLLLSVMQQVTPKTQWGMTTTYYKEKNT